MLLLRSIIFACLVTCAISGIWGYRPINRTTKLGEASYSGNEHHVSIQFNGDHHCSGSIISRRYIITSYTCIRTYSANDGLRKFPQSITVVVGIDSIASDGDKYEIEAIYIPNSASNIGLIKTSHEIRFRPGVQPIEIADYKSFPDNSPLKITAWDHSPIEGVSGRWRLQEYAQRLYNKNECAQKFEWNKRKNLCSYDPSGKGLCHTDAGGAIIANGYLIGIHSNDAECFDGGEPKAHTPISPDLDWIQQKLGVISEFTQMEADRGHSISDNRHKYLVAIKSVKTGHICSGSILNHRHILTSHICIASHDVNDLRVTAGVDSLTMTGDTYKIQRIIPHEDWNYDIAILRTSEDIELNENVFPIPITKNSYDVHDGKTVMLVGYEQSLINHRSSDNLEQHTLRVLNRAKCMDTIPFLEERYMCSVESLYRTSCHMDDGSAVVADGILIAMKPSGVRCGDNIHVHLSLYGIRSWIVENSRGFY